MRNGVRLGVDVGSVRVGLAVCDPSGMIATSVETLTRDTPSDGKLPTEIARIVTEARERGAIEVVVGLPLSLSGSGGAAAEAARGYAEALAHALRPTPVRLVDERLTTVSAHQALHRSGRSGRRHRAVVDQVAAAMILQQALDTERTSGRLPGSLVELPEAEAPSPTEED